MVVTGVPSLSPAGGGCGGVLGDSDEARHV